jgi:RNA polymerase sigma-70 factor (ECF subfamily)
MDESSYIDAVLLARIAQRDPQALEAFYDRHAKHVFSQALAVLKDPDSAKDLSQEVFLLVWRHAATYRPTGPPRSWLLRLTRNRAIDELRQRQRRFHIDLTLSENVYETFAVGSDPGDTAQRLGARQVVDSLPAAQREALLLAFFRGMTHQEIANHLRLPLGTIKARIRRALLTLRQAFQDKENLS